MTDVSPFSLLVKPAGAACNLACDYCFYLDKASLYKDAPQIMPKDVLERMIASYLELPFDSFSIVFQGGEPLLAELDFFRSAADSVRRHLKTGSSAHLAVQTNATLMTQELARFFADEGWLVGVSVDGPACIHDAHRRTPSGGGSYARAMRGISRLREAGAPFNVLCLVTPDNMERPAQIYRHLRDEVGARWMQFSILREHVSIAQWDGFLCGVLDAWTADGDAGRVFVGNIEAAVAYLRLGRADQCIFADRCDGHLVVERNGDVYPCDFFVSKETLLGNIMEKGWTELRSSATARRFAETKCPRHLSRIPHMRFYERMAML